MGFLELDGLEGGGQILRTSLSLSAILNRPFKITNIRAKRPKPGLKPQHLMCINAVKQICDAEVKGDVLESKELEFKPHKISSGNYEFIIHTAGSISLVVQTILPILIFAKEKSMVKITGGTHVPFAPTVSYLKKVFLPALKKMNIQAEIKVKKYGFYPKGGGEILLTVFPIEKIKPLILSNSDKIDIYAELLLCNLPKHIIEREEKILKEYFPEISIDYIESKTQSPGNALLIYKDYVGISRLGKIGIPAEKLAKQMCEEFISYNNYLLDNYLLDQLLLYFTLSNEKSEVVFQKLTDHAKTNINTIELFFGNVFKIEGNKISGFNGKTRN